jgi:FkbM family methyltransferase
MKKFIILFYSNILEFYFKILRYYSRPFTLKYSNKKIGKFLPFGQVSFGIWCGWFEKEEVEIFIKLIKNSRVFIDIGANSGLYTVIASKEMDSVNRIIAFEPSSINFKFLLSNIEVNNIHSIVEAFNFGLSDYEACGKLLMEDESIDGEAYIDRNSIVSSKIIDGPYVQLDTLDNVLSKNNISNVDFIKIDTEGYEYFILKGAKSTIINNENLILMFECNDEGTKRAGTSFDDVFNLLEEYGLKMFYWDNETMHWSSDKFKLQYNSNGQFWACKDINHLKF